MKRGTVMRNPLAAAVVLSLLVPGIAEAFQLTHFGDGGAELVAELAPPECTAVFNVSVPADCLIRKATLDLSSVLPDAGPADCPDRPSLWLEDDLLWEFNWTDFGALGWQDSFSGGIRAWSTAFDSGGGQNGTTIRLPKSAVVQSAGLKVGCSGPTELCRIAFFKGNYTAGELGASVSIAGDVNGDGYDDLLVGAPEAASAGPQAGKAYIYYGGAKINTTPDVVMAGENAQDRFGTCVAGAGDVNRDGRDDVIIGAPYYESSGSPCGRAYLFYGGAAMDSRPDIVFTGVTYDDMGCAVSGAGDVNGDGYDDVIAGVPGNYATGVPTGRTYIYFGGPAMDSSADVILKGEKGKDRFGTAVSSAGDLNADGFGDVVVSAINFESHRGKAYVFFGGAPMDAAAEANFSEGQWNDFFGCSVCGAGDVNGDGYGDVLVGSKGNDAGGNAAGRAFIYFGGTVIDSAADVTITGACESDLLGSSVSGIGDFDRDGFDDVVVGAPQNWSDAAMAGRVYLFRGGPGMDSIPDLLFNGSSQSDQLGLSVSGTGDTNRDGHNSLLIGGTNQYCVYDYQDGLLGPNVSIGQAVVWNNSWYFNRTAATGDFSEALNDFILKNPKSGTDTHGNSYTDVPVQISAKNRGNLTLSGLNISYICDLAVPDFAPKLNGYIAAHRSEKGPDGNLTVQFLLKSRRPGKLELFKLNVTVDEPPRLVRPIQAAGMDEDTAVTELVDLYQFFQDDYDVPAQLRFGVVSATNGSIVTLGIVGNRYLSADALEGPQNDNWTGIVNVAVNCTDHYGSTRESNLFRIVVRNVPDPPVITSLPPLEAVAGQEYIYQITGADGDALEALAYELERGPPNMMVDPENGRLSWVPPARGIYPVSVSVTDGLFWANQGFSINVPNRPPRITNTTVPEAFSGEPYSYAIPASDDDRDPLSFALASLPFDDMALDAATGTLTWTPREVGKFPVKVSVSDGTASVPFDFNIAVRQGNRAPRFQTLPTTVGIAGLLYSYNASAADQDGDSLTYVLVAMPPGMTINASSGQIAWTPSAAGDFSVKLKALDGRGGEGAQEYVIKVAKRTRPRIEITAPAEGQNVRGKLAVAGKATKGSLAIVGIQLRVDSGDWVNVTGNSTWTYTLDTARLKDGKHTLEARAYDGLDYSDTASRTVTVENRQAAGKGFIPGFGGPATAWVMAIFAAIAIRKRRS